MRAAGLTHGGFYAHFPSKEALVAEVCASSLARAASRWERISQRASQEASQAPGQGASADVPGHAAALAEIVGTYLDPAHVAAVERGCILAALGPEVARRPGARSGLTDALGRMLDALGRCLPDWLPAPRRRDRALAALSTMVGAVVLARLSSDDRLAAGFLAAAKADVLSDENAVRSTGSRDQELASMALFGQEKNRPTSPGMPPG